MATLAKTTEPLESIPGVEFITEGQGKAILDRQAQKTLGISGEEFVRRLRAGEIEEPNSSEVTRLVFLISFAEP